MTSPSSSPVRGASARLRVLVSAAVGVVVGVAVGATSAEWRISLLIGWMTGSVIFLAWMWATIWPMSGADTQSHARREDPGQAMSDLVILGAAVASLGAVGLFLSGGGSSKVLTAGLSVMGVALAWGTVHTVFTTRYARLYYKGSRGGIDFNEKADPRYREFAYLAFTVGMTFQVSDTDITRQEVRDAVFRQMLLSYLLGAVVIATTINLVAGLAK